MKTTFTNTTNKILKAHVRIHTNTRAHIPSYTSSPLTCPLTYIASIIYFDVCMSCSCSQTGHITPSRTWYLYYDTDNFQLELAAVVWEIMPLYQELHAYLLKCVRNTYGEKLNADEGTIPAHVLEQIIRQAWSPRPVFRTPFPTHQLPTVKQRLEEILVTPVKIIKKSAEFFESIGLNHMSE